MKLKIQSTSYDVLSPRNGRQNGIAKNPREREYYTGRNIISLLSRALLSAIFLYSGLDKILHPLGNQQYMAAHGMSFTGLFLLCAIVIELVGGLSLLLGYKARWGAMALVIFLIPTTLIFHRDFSDQMQIIHFLKNLAIMSGLLMTIQNGPGGMALDKGRSRLDA